MMLMYFMKLWKSPMGKWLAGIAAAVISGVLVVLITQRLSLKPERQPSSLKVSQLTSRSGRYYEARHMGLESGARVYSDRNFVYTVVHSALKGKTYIITANEDKFNKGDVS